MIPDGDTIQYKYQKVPREGSLFHIYYYTLWCVLNCTWMYLCWRHVTSTKLSTHTGPSKWSLTQSLSRGLCPCSRNILTIRMLPAKKKAVILPILGQREDTHRFDLLTSVKFSYKQHTNPVFRSWIIKWKILIKTSPDSKKQLSLTPDIQPCKTRLPLTPNNHAT